MRVLYCFFSLIAILIALLLLMHSLLLFAVYVGALPAVLLLTWYLRSDPQGTEVPSQESGYAAGLPLTAEGRRPQLDSTIDPGSSARRAVVIRKFWNRTLLVVLIPIVSVTIIAVSERWRIPDHLWFAIPVLVLGTWFVLIWGLASISRILLFKRNETHFPKWSVLFGVVTTFVLAFFALSPLSVVFLLPIGCNAPTNRIPPNAFKVNQTIKLTMSDSGIQPITQRFEIEPRSSFSIVGIEDLKSGRLAEANIETLEKFEFGNFENIPLEAMLLDLQTPLVAQTQNMGLLRSKLTFSLPAITLLARDLSKPIRSKAAPWSDYADDNQFLVSRASDYHASLEIEMPKDSFIAASPKAEFAALPDKDVITFNFTQSPQVVEVYYLRRARLKVIRELLSQSSNHDIAISVLAFLFWPLVMILIGVFHKALADRILGLSTSLFKKRSAKVIGFSGPPK